MIVFGVAISDRAVYARIAQPSIRRVAQQDAVVLARYNESIQAAYNDMMDETAALPGLEALILMHQDLELRDDSLIDRVRPLLREPGAGVVGLLGARNVPLERWTEAKDLYGSAVAPGIDTHFSSGPCDVEVVDGVLLALAPWVVRGLRFSEAFAEDFHGYDVDLCMRVRAAGGRVICDDIPYFHHMSRLGDDDLAALARSGQRLVKMWGPSGEHVKAAPRRP